MKFAKVKNKMSGLLLDSGHKLSCAYWKQVPDEIEEKLQEAVNFRNAEIIELNEKEIKADIDNISKSVSSLRDKFNVYYNKLKEKSGDISGLDI